MIVLVGNLILMISSKIFLAEGEIWAKIASRSYLQR